MKWLLRIVMFFTSGIFFFTSRKNKWRIHRVGGASVSPEKKYNIIFLQYCWTFWVQIRLHARIDQPRPFNVIDRLWQPRIPRFWKQQTWNPRKDGYSADDDLRKESPQVLQQQDERSHRDSYTTHEIVVAQSVLSGETKGEYPKLLLGHIAWPFLHRVASEIERWTFSR